MDKKDLQYVTDEYEVLKRLNNKNVLKVYDLIERKSDYLLIMEYIDGITLDKYIHQEFSNLKEIDQYINMQDLLKDLQANFKFTDTYVENGNIIYQNIVKEQIKKNYPQIYQSKKQYSQEYLRKIPIIIQQLVTTLQYIHSMKIMHRDIKIENIMIQNDRIIFIDFGYAGKHELQSTLVGTVGFQAPECSLVSKGQRKYTKKIDVWSLGQVMFELVAGYNKNIISHNLYLNAIQQNLGLWLPLTLFLQQNAIDQLNLNTNYIELIQSCFIVDPAMRASSNDLVDMLNQNKQTKEQLSIKIVLLGSYNVGKTTLLRKMSKQYIKQDISQISTPVLYTDQQNKKYSIRCTFVDTCGIENVSSASLPISLFRADLCLLVYKLFDQESYQALEFYENIYKNINGENMNKNQIQVIANDWDEQDNRQETIKYKDYITLYVNSETSQINLLNNILRNYFQGNQLIKDKLDKSYIETKQQKQSQCCQ